MWFDARRALAELDPDQTAIQEPSPSAIRAIPAIPTPSEPPRIARIARIAWPEAENPKPAAAVPAPAECPFGQSVGGSPLTWTGRVVSLDEWRRLSKWERSGPNGRVWDGIKRAWVYPDGSA
jgi:hypothetical protein